MRDGIRRRVERFSTALSLALYDRELEVKGHPITYYFDADVIYGMVMGFEAEVPSSGASSDQLLVRALLSCGYLGPFCLLRPHAFELNEKLRSHTQLERREDRAVFRAKAQRFLRSRGILDTMSELHQVVSEEGIQRFANEEERVERFLEILRDKSGETFAHIEQVHGTWWQRLRRYRETGRLCLDRLGPETRELIDQHQEALGAMNSALRRRRPKYTFNVFQDAAALTILHSQIRARDEGRPVDVVRFHTETRAIVQEIQEDEELRDLLSYRVPIDDGLSVPPGAEMVVRGSRYFILRAWFTELTPVTDDADLRALDDMKRLAGKLQDLLEAGGEELEAAIDDIRYNGTRVRKLIKDLEDLAIVDSLWTRRRIPDELRQLEALRQWTAVFEFAETPNADEVVLEQIRDVREELESRVSNIRQWMADLETVLAALRVARRRLRGKISNTMRDLGLIRWGYALSECETDDLLSTLDSLLGKDENVDLTLGAARLAMRMERARHDPDECLIVCAILWGLRCFSDIVRLAASCRNRVPDDEIPPSLIVVQAAAEARTGVLLRHKRRQATARMIWDLQRNLPGNERTPILLGAAYVLYHAWRLETIGNRARWCDTEPSAKACRWAERSFALGEEAFRVLPENELAWAFAVNHCAYVGLTTGIQPDKTRFYFETLLRLESLTELWNARFADTVGCYYLFKAERLWRETRPEHRARLDLSDYLARAREYFLEAESRDIGDTDLEEHMNRLNILRDEYGQSTRGPVGRDGQGPANL